MGGVCTTDKVKNLLQDLVATDDIEQHHSYSLGNRERTFEKCYGPGHWRYQGFGPEPQKGVAELWDFTEHAGFQIAVTASNQVDVLEVATMEEAKEIVKKDPHKYFGCHWCQSGWSVQSWGKNKAKVFPRECKFFRDGIEEKAPKNAYCAMVATYKQLHVDVDPSSEVRDVYTEGILKHFKNADYSFKMPGRLQGIADMPGLCIVGDVDAYDIRNGSVADLWLLGAFASIAEFGPSVIKRFFKHTPGLDQLPAPGWNTYKITLYDLRTDPPWHQDEIVVDERLLWNEAKFSLLGCKPTRTGELWPCILEKAIAAHCGGWEYIHGGNITHAWRLLLGTPEVYTIKLKNGKAKAFGTFNPNRKSWEHMANAPHNPVKTDAAPGQRDHQRERESFQGLWPMTWPEKGGGGRRGKSISTDELFKKMCAWDDANYIMTALGVKDDQKGKGTVVGHMYTVRQIVNNAGGSGFDMLELRARSGISEIQLGGWEDSGKKWEEYPEVFRACGEPTPRDDGMFWIQKEDFFTHFYTIYLCAQDMKAWVEMHDGDVMQVEQEHYYTQPDYSQPDSQRGTDPTLGQWEAQAPDEQWEEGDDPETQGPGALS
jgi:hypothetical protein